MLNVNSNQSSDISLLRHSVDDAILAGLILLKQWGIVRLCAA
jgi:hypothetical protein